MVSRGYRNKSEHCMRNLAGLSPGVFEYPFPLIMVLIYDHDDNACINRGL